MDADSERKRKRKKIKIPYCNHQRSMLYYCRLAGHRASRDTKQTTDNRRQTMVNYLIRYNEYNYFYERMIEKFVVIVAANEDKAKEKFFKLFPDCVLLDCGTVPRYAA